MQSIYSIEIYAYGTIKYLLSEEEELDQPGIDKMYLYVEGPYKAKYQFLVNKRESTGLNHWKTQSKQET